MALACRERCSGQPRLNDGAVVFAYPVRDPERYGVVEFDDNNQALSLEEKPATTPLALCGPRHLFLRPQSCRFRRALKPSPRGELEITDLNKLYLAAGKLQVQVLGRGVAWLDAGTHESLLQAATFVQTVEERQGMMISCPEEIAYRMGFIDKDQLRKEAVRMAGNSYGAYLLQLADGKIE